jgi:hypothetical protein
MVLPGYGGRGRPSRANSELDPKATLIRNNGVKTQRTEEAYYLMPNDGGCAWVFFDWFGKGGGGTLHAWHGGLTGRPDQSIVV